MNVDLLDEDDLPAADRPPCGGDPGLGDVSVDQDVEMSVARFLKLEDRDERNARAILPFERSPEFVPALPDVPRRSVRKLGFKDVKVLKGGLGAWIIAGLSIESRSDLAQVGVEVYKSLASGNV
jgi:hypothetical protein